MGLDYILAVVHAPGLNFSGVFSFFLIELLSLGYPT